MPVMKVYNGTTAAWEDIGAGGLTNPMTAADDFVQLYGYYSTGSFTTKTVLGFNDTPTTGSSLSLQEVPSW